MGFTPHLWQTLDGSGYSIGFLLMGVSGMAAGELCLNRISAHSSDECLSPPVSQAVLKHLRGRLWPSTRSRAMDGHGDAGARRLEGGLAQRGVFVCHVRGARANQRIAVVEVFDFGVLREARAAGSAAAVDFARATACVSSSLLCSIAACGSRISTGRTNRRTR